MSRAFLSPSRCEPGTLASPLRRALDRVSETFDRKERGSHAETVATRLVRDVSLAGIVEIRGDVSSVSPGSGEEIVRLSPRRAYLFTDDDPADVAERLRAGGVLAYDATGALAGMEIASEQVMRRLTDLDLDAVPTAGPFAHVTAIFRRGADGSYLVYVQQELGHYVAEAVVDAFEGLGQTTAGAWLKPGTEAQTTSDARLKPGTEGQTTTTGAGLQPGTGREPDAEVRA